MFIGGGIDLDLSGEKEKNKIESRVRIFIGVVVGIHYMYKTLRYDGLEKEMKYLSAEVEILKKEIKSIKDTSSQLPHE